MTIVVSFSIVFGLTVVSPDMTIVVSFGIVFGLTVVQISLKILIAMIYPYMEHDRA